MKIARTFLALCLFVPTCLFVAQAQGEMRAVWQVTRYDITATVSTADRALTSRANLTLRYVGRVAGSTLTLRINPQAEVKTASVNDAAATFTTMQDQGNLKKITIRLPASVNPNSTIKVVIDYRVPVAENSGLSAISPAGVQFLPLSFWCPVPNNPYVLSGITDSAPFRLTITAPAGLTIVSSGKASGSTIEQTINGQPFFVAGNWDVRAGSGAAGNVSALLPVGVSADERKQADALLEYTAAARDFYATLLGPAPATPIQLVAVTRGAGFDDAGTVLLDAAVFRRSKMDSATALLIAEAVARLWLGGATPVRGQGTGVVREGLARYLATLFMEKQFGRETADAERMRERLAYAAVARRDSPLSRTTPLDETYYSSVNNKGAMIWRLSERALGGDAFINILRTQLQTGASDEGGLSLASLRAALTERGGAQVKTLLDQGLDQPTDMDLLVGVPQQRGGQWVSALRNLGSIDATVTVAATTTRGERVTAEATVPARDFGEAVFKTTGPITRVEVDPDKLYPQLDYANDVAPRARSTGDTLAEAASMLARQEYTRAETAARELLTLAPRMQEARILLARSLVGLNRADEAEKEFRTALDERLPTPATLAWANLGLGEIALRKGQMAEAARHFNEAVRTGADYASQLAARAGRIKAESGSAQPPVDESARAFLSQLDQAIKTGRKADIDALIVPGELAAFSKGLVGSQPELWQTRALRTEQLDANRLAVDVSLNTKQLGREQAGTALFILARVGGGWRLAGIELFEVK